MRDKLKRSRMIGLVVLAVMSALMLVASPAGAAVSAQQGYSQPGGRIETSFDPGHASLPFTGLDILAVVAIGAALLAVGVGIRRLSRSAAH